MQTEYVLKYKDEQVLIFDIDRRSVKVLQPQLLPMSINIGNITYSDIQMWCADRILMMNREYCKEILTGLGIDSQDDVTICLTGMGLSFRDNYWVIPVGSLVSWKNVNLYVNEFSHEVASLAITGEMKGTIYLTDKLFTGELTSKGTRAKCYLRKNNKIYMVKAETITEINAEIVSTYIANLLGIVSAEYRYSRAFHRNCSICEVKTSEQIEFTPCRDVMRHFREQKIDVNSQTYKYFLTTDTEDFVLMQIFDYLTLNTDRNRDNYAIGKNNGVVFGLYPLFDHDSCFKGKSTNGIYFPTNLTFHNTIEYLKTNGFITNNIKQRLQNLVNNLQTIREDITLRLTKEIYDSFENRLTCLLKSI